MQDQSWWNSTHTETCHLQLRYVQGLLATSVWQWVHHAKLWEEVLIMSEYNYDIESEPHDLRRVICHRLRDFEDVGNYHSLRQVVVDAGVTETLKEESLTQLLLFPVTFLSCRPHQTPLQDIAFCFAPTCTRRWLNWNWNKLTSILFLQSFSTFLSFGLLLSFSTLSVYIYE